MSNVDGMFIQRQILRKQNAIPIRCSICNCHTGLDSSVPVSERLFYDEALGQLCRNCYEDIVAY